MGPKSSDNCDIFLQSYATKYLTRMSSLQRPITIITENYSTQCLTQDPWRQTSKQLYMLSHVERIFLQIHIRLTIQKGCLTLSEQFDEWENHESLFPVRSFHKNTSISVAARFSFIWDERYIWIYAALFDNDPLFVYRRKSIESFWVRRGMMVESSLPFKNRRLTAMVVSKVKNASLKDLKPLPLLKKGLFLPTHLKDNILTGKTEELSEYL